MKNILVTGGAGFIGTNLTQRLIQEGFQVVVIDDLSSGKEKNLVSGTKFVNGDIKNKQLISTLFKEHEIDVVFHLAAQINVRDSVKDPSNDAANNILGTLNLLEAAQQAKIQKFIFASSGATYGDPTVFPTPESYHLNPNSPYGLTKMVGEKYLKFYHSEHGLKYGILRYSNVYGPRQNHKGEAGVVSIFINQMLTNSNPVIFGDGKQTRDFIYVDDIVEANFALLDNLEVCDTFNASVAAETDINTIFFTLNKLFNNKYFPVYGAPLKGEVQRSCLDNIKLKTELNWQPKIDLEEGLTKTYDFFQNYG